MNKSHKGKEFLKKLWDETEPIVNDLIVYLFVMLAFEIVHRLTSFLLSAELKELVQPLKEILIGGAVCLLIFRTLGVIFIRVIGVFYDEKAAIKEKIIKNIPPKKDLLNLPMKKAVESVPIKKTRRKTTETRIKK